MKFAGEPVGEFKVAAEPRLKLDRLNIFGDGLNSNKPLKVWLFFKRIHYLTRVVDGRRRKNAVVFEEVNISLDKNKRQT